MLLLARLSDTRGIPIRHRRTLAHTHRRTPMAPSDTPRPQTPNPKRSFLNPQTLYSSTLNPQTLNAAQRCSTRLRALGLCLEARHSVPDHEQVWQRVQPQLMVVAPVDGGRVERERTQVCLTPYKSVSTRRVWCYAKQRRCCDFGGVPVP